MKLAPKFENPKFANPKFERPALQAWTIILLALVSLCFTAPRGRSQGLQRGISVELAPTSNAQPMPDADSERALIVSITDNGATYLGIDPVTPSALADQLKASLANRQQIVKTLSGPGVADVAA